MAEQASSAKMKGVQSYFRAARQVQTAAPVFGLFAQFYYLLESVYPAIAICGTGIGIGIAAGKVKGIRVCTCSEPFSARMSRRHNNTNVLTFGARVVGVEMARMIVDEWLDNQYEGGRHQRRVDLLMEIE